jgi:hypothetical protein
VPDNPCFVDFHFSSRDFATLRYTSTEKSTNYHSLRFLASDDPGDGQLKPLYESVAQHHPDRGVLSGALEVISFDVNFASKLTDSRHINVKNITEASQG